MIEIYPTRFFSAVDLGVGFVPSSAISTVDDGAWYVFAREPRESWRQWHGPFQTRELAERDITRFSSQDVDEFGLVVVQV